MERDDKQVTVLYLCDRKQCDPCWSGCFYTTFIDHAINFQPDLGGCFREVKDDDRTNASSSD